MSHHLTFVGSEFNNKRRKTRKEIFHSRMNELMSWDQLEAIIESFYPTLAMEEDLICYLPCSVFTVCNIGTTLVIQRWRMPCMKLRPCAYLLTYR